MNLEFRQFPSTVLALGDLSAPNWDAECERAWLISRPAVIRALVRLGRAQNLLASNNAAVRLEALVAIGEMGSASATI